jgi:hypothetical protein
MDIEKLLSFYRQAMIQIEQMIHQSVQQDDYQQTYYEEEIKNH